MTQKQRYQILLNYVRENGLKVHHIKMTNTDGQYDSETGLIEISTRIKDTNRGSFILLHEYGHYIEYRDKLFPNFFRGFGKFTKRGMREVIFAEVYAYEFAQKMMTGLGVECEPYELTPDGFKEFKTFWKKYYFIS